MLSSDVSRRPRTPGLVLAALCSVLIVLIGIFALTTHQPPPPTIAEFAPQAVEQISDSPDDQSSRAGTGVGDCAPGQSGCGLGEGGGDGAAAAATPLEVSRVRKCVGDPPRQIEDPQSPPCVPYWSGDNGGETWKGVTGDTIRVAAPDHDDALHRDLQNFFNKRFEFYGRKLQVIDTADGQGATPELQQAAAVKADEQHRIFASLDNSHGGGYFYYRELARRGLVSVSSQPAHTEGELRALAPHVWQYPMGVDGMASSIGAWVCARLAGRNAAHAGFSDLTDMSAQKRVFGIIVWAYAVDSQIKSEMVEKELSACGERAVVKLRFTAEIEGVFNPNSANNSVLQMKDEGVTSVICLCHTIASGMMYRSANSQRYHPEWLISTYLLNDYNFDIKSFANEPSQNARMFGLSFIPKQVPLDDNPSWWAVREADPGRVASNNSVATTVNNIQYRSMLLLASGIQMAGPRLTPATFEAALHRTSFPNPDTPLQMGKVGFSRGDHSMTDDVAEIWWSNTARGPQDDDQGAYCYVDGGARRRPREFGRDDPFFTPTVCDTGAAT